MRDEILDHYNDEDIRNIYIKRDVSKWHKHLVAISEEVTFYTKLLSALQGSSNDEVSPKSDALIAAFTEIAAANQDYLDNLVDYRNQIGNIKECQDMQCEKFYLNSHEAFTETIETHLDCFRGLKSQVRELFWGNLEIRIE